MDDETTGSTTSDSGTPAPPGKRRLRGGLRVSALLSRLNAPAPRREELEIEGAAELNRAIAPSMERLKAEVPHASSPEEAWRTIESELEEPVPDPDAEVPQHPVYSGDALVYYQLRRHYGSPSGAGSFRQGWRPGSGTASRPSLAGRVPEGRL